jgi:hypothetical protein
VQAVCGGEPTQSQAQSRALVTEPQVRQWVRDLNADRFIDREVATERLIDAGAVAVGPLQESLAENNLEVTTRAMHILCELAVSSESETADAARAALEKIADARVTSAARRARDTLNSLDQIRQERALAELKQLGAVLGERQSQFGFEVVGQYALEFGEKWQGQPKDLARLRWLPDLSEVTFVGPQVTDEWLKHLAGLGGLAKVTIKRANITDEGVKSLANLKNVDEIGLLYVPITDRVVEYLSVAEGIGKIRLYGTRVTAPATERLKELLSGTEIDYRKGGALLGVKCQPGQQGCLIYAVPPNTAADKAELRANDLICEYNGQKVADFKALTDLIAQHRPGDTVTVKILRDGEMLTKSVTLGEWQE